MKSHKFIGEISLYIIRMVKYKTSHCTGNEVKLLQVRDKQEVVVVIQPTLNLLKPKTYIMYYHQF